MQTPFYNILSSGWPRIKNTELLAHGLIWSMFTHLHAKKLYRCNEMRSNGLFCPYSSTELIKKSPIAFYTLNTLCLSIISIFTHVLIKSVQAKAEEIENRRFLANLPTYRPIINKTSHCFTRHLPSRTN